MKETISKKEDNVWLPVVLKKQRVVRHTEGYGASGSRDFYHYTTLEDEEVLFYNRATGIIKNPDEVIMGVKKENEK